MRYWTAEDNPHDGWHGVGVLLVNHGSPDEPTPRAVRRYLAGFLSDQRLIEIPRLIWLPILHGIILNTRPRRVAKAYARVWTDSGPPINVFTEGLSQSTNRLIQGEHGPRIAVAYGMTYGRPSIEHALENLRNWGARRILILPLYPQYSATTVGSVFDRVTATLQKWRWVPELRFVQGYEDHPQYIAALADSIREHWAKHGRGEKLLFSFHGLPQSYADAGDPYPCYCQRTARLTAERLGLQEDQWMVSYQSKFGPAKWLTPYTQETLEALGAKGHKSLDIVCPGFAVECLETVEEVADELAGIAANAGAALRYIPCLNDRDDHARLMMSLVNENLGQRWQDALQPMAEVPRTNRDRANSA